MDDLDTRRRRAALNQTLFREVNERIAALSDRYADELRPNSYICECLSPDCAAMLELSHDEYERFREQGARFFVLPGHEDPAVEDVVETTEQYVVVEKIGVASAIAESTNPRRNGSTP
ncbi:MAG TPA: hypothetical protein VGK69_05655 [Gaiellaceae bacterium]